jgi:hypothetical protein
MLALLGPIPAAKKLGKVRSIHTRSYHMPWSHMPWSHQIIFIPRPVGYVAQTGSARYHMSQNQKIRLPGALQSLARGGGGGGGGCRRCGGALRG